VRQNRDPEVEQMPRSRNEQSMAPPRREESSCTRMGVMKDFLLF